ncbi:MAG TPA: methyl-accepting chemotaxis protein, partial [Burkholderiaceae bacterium]|nr:methyl-accepting chemotaxis protein [Burkholderiaceae bacterium]
MNLNNLSVRGQLALAFGILAALVLLVAGLALKSLTDAEARFTGYVHGINAHALMADAVRSAVDRRAIAARNVVLATRPEDLETEKAAASRAQADVMQRLDSLKEMVRAPEVSDEVRSLVARIDKVELSYRPVAAAI